MKRKIISKAKRERVYSLTGFHCSYCGSVLTLKNRTVDHLIPLSKGGDNSFSNLIPACRACNKGKANRFPWELRRWGVCAYQSLIESFLMVAKSKSAAAF